MSDYRIPQYVDPVIKFSGLHYNTTPTGINLTSIDNFYCSISKGKPSGSYMVTLDYSNPAESGRFTINNTEKSVSVSFLRSEIGNVLGCYYANLWLVDESRQMTHYSLELEIVPSVPPMP